MSAVFVAGVVSGLLLGAALQWARRSIDLPWRRRTEPQVMRDLGSRYMGRRGQTRWTGGRT